MMMRFLVALFLFAMPVQAAVPIKEVVSPGGIKAWLVEEHSIPFVALEIRFRGGTSLDPEGKRGVVNLMTGLIEEGTGDLDAQGFAEARDALAADFRFNVGQDSLSVSARMLTENRDQSVDLLRQALVSPRFDEAAITRVRGQVLSMIRSDDTDPGAIANRAFDRAAFGAHPYGSSGDGTAETVSALTRDDILAAHRAAIARDRVYVAAVGDITAEELGALMDRLLGDLPETGAPLPGRADYALKGGVTVVDYPSPQSLILFGHEGIKRDDPDFFAAFILNEILGGQRFTGRLMTEIREKRGLTYGVGSYLAAMDQAELVMGQLSTDNRTAGQVIDLIRAEWRKIVENGVSPEELAAAQTYLTGAYPLRFDGNRPIANILVGMQMEGLPITYVETRNDQINAVTVEDIARVAGRLLQPDALHFVVVGKPEGIGAAP
ncbi:insulinase family protein [Aliigemmobacter aestuarii]|uniref:Insulinase family protein n=1 Tax=Aliigemmobacter aestuarii TaxID=1445661 RepID=A0A4S3MMZ9_9RHOB|nr:pitrilysin family protein [Gemmobacter aestuarii]THD83647.1 insulinase family protein [Gemmobacter aestuarii]